MYASSVPRYYSSASVTERSDGAPKKVYAIRSEYRGLSSGSLGPQVVAEECICLSSLLLQLEKLTLLLL